MMLLKRALVSALEPTVGSLLARDPGDEPDDPLATPGPALFYGTRNDSAPVYPSVTFRLDSRPDARFKPSEAAGGGPSPVWNHTLEMEAWSQNDSAAESDAIATAIQAVLDGKIIPFPNNAGRAFDIACTLKSDGFWDKDLNAWFVLLRFTLITETNQIAPNSGQ